MDKYIRRFVARELGYCQNHCEHGGKHGECGHYAFVEKKSEWCMADKYKRLEWGKPRND